MQQPRLEEHPDTLRGEEVVPSIIELNEAEVDDSGTVLLSWRPLADAETYEVRFYRSDLSGCAVEDVVTRPLIVADDAWIGARALILPGCARIGRGAVVAAGAVVTRDVPDYAVVAGNPARVIRHRFDEPVRHAADRTSWWQLPPEQVLAQYPLNDSWCLNETEEAR